MPPYITKGDLRDLAEQVGKETLRKSLVEAEARSPSGTLFLSHSSKDNEFIPIVVRILENHGATVYVDKIDPTLNSKGPKSIAETLRIRVRSCRKFMMFASESSKDSRWMPWELGLADGHKGPSCTALIPASDDTFDTEWAEREYLGTYDRLVWGELEGHAKPLWMIWNQDANSAVSLSNWISR